MEERAVFLLVLVLFLSKRGGGEVITREDARRRCCVRMPKRGVCSDECPRRFLKPFFLYPQRKLNGSSAHERSPSPPAQASLSVARHNRSR
eukprot:2624515-Rhodomonas_salina.3